ncbi:DUF3617 domain-containing protein [Sphingomonas sp. LB-2]|uniref:DUF3617 domain-containing protein n=1 Tax=Sphingomonas caeni TaxID=2984949 RepID=UPI0022325DE1|nr:DUF3617 domain-containing protein [Sphingomonas caeni]MCW3847940.1 DUF3617 domain-containing protein [Sphingomonas caeni]
MKRARLLLPALALLSGCDVAGDPYAPRAGLWEIKGSFVTLEGPGVTPQRIAELRRRMPPPTVSRECFDGHASRVGDVKEGGRCKVTRVSDAGAVADNEWQCAGRGNEGLITSAIHGSRGPERYDYRIATSSIRRGDKAATVVVTREQGRRLGDCPAKS